METAKVARGTLYIAAQNIIQYSIILFFYVALARILSQTEVGELSLLKFAMGVFNTLTLLSLPTASEKFVSENLGRGNMEGASAAVNTALKLILAISVPSLILTLWFSPQLSQVIFGTEADASLLMITLIVSFTLNLITFFGANMLGLGMFAEMAVQNLTFVIVSKVVGIFLAWLGLGLMGVVLGWLIGLVPCIVVTYIFLRGRFVRSREDFPVRGMLAYSSPIFIYAVIGFLQGWIDTTLLYALTSNLAITGIYYLAMAGTTILSIVWSPISMTIFPAISAQHGRGRPEGIRQALRVSTRQLNLMVIPLGVSLAAISQTAIIVAYGPGYLTGSIPFAILTLAAIVPAYANLFTNALQGIGETRVLIKIGIVSTLTDALVMVLLVKPLGVVGAAIARLMMFVTVSVLSYRMLKARVKLSVDTSSLRKVIPLSATLAIPLAMADWILIHLIPLNLLVRILIEGAIFVGLGLMAMKIWKPFEKQDIELLRHAVPKQLYGILDFVERTFCPSP